MRHAVDGFYYHVQKFRPESLRAFADEASPSRECEPYDPSLSYHYSTSP